MSLLGTSVVCRNNTSHLRVAYTIGSNMERTPMLIIEADWIIVGYRQGAKGEEVMTNTRRYKNLGPAVKYLMNLAKSKIKS